MADISSERSVDEVGLTQGDEVGAQHKIEREFLGGLPVKRQRRDSDAPIQSATTQDKRMLPPLERHFGAVGTDLGRRYVTHFQERSGGDQARTAPIT